MNGRVIGVHLFSRFTTLLDEVNKVGVLALDVAA
jgi:hypothetical protein